MRRFIAISAAVVVAIGLTGCASTPLKASDVDTVATVSTTSDLLVGDKVTITSSAQVLHKRTDKVTLQTESSTDGKTWTPLGKKSKKSGTFKSANEVTLAASETQYRSTVHSIGEKPKLLARSAPVKLTVYDIKELTRTLYYNQAQAFQASTAAGIAYDQANNYPNEFDMTNAGWVSGVATSTQDGLKRGAVPDLITISPAPTWTDPGSTCNVAGTTPPKGRTFVVTIDETDTYTDYLPSSSKADVHVTLLDGKLYFYEPYCQ